MIGGGYMVYRSRAAAQSAIPQYFFGTAERGTITVTVNGTGQVSATNQIDIKPEVSGKVLSILVKPGQEVTAGTKLLQLDSNDAYRSVRDASLNLQSAQLSLQKLTQAADSLTLAQAEDALRSAQDTVTKLELSQQTDLAKAQDTAASAVDDTKKAYDDALSDLSSTYIDLPSIVTGINDLLYGTTIAAAEGYVGQPNSAALQLILVNAAV